MKRCPTTIAETTSKTCHHDKPPVNNPWIRSHSLPKSPCKVLIREIGAKREPKGANTIPKDLDGAKGGDSQKMGIMIPIFGGSKKGAKRMPKDPGESRGRFPKDGNHDSHLWGVQKGNQREPKGAKTIRKDLDGAKGAIPKRWES